MLVKLDIANEDRAKTVNVSLMLKDKNGNLASQVNTQVALPEQGSKPVALEMMVKEPLLWSPDSPHLYDLFVTIKTASLEPVDSLRKRIGIRTIEMRGPEAVSYTHLTLPTILRV